MSETKETPKMTPLEHLQHLMNESYKRDKDAVSGCSKKETYALGFAMGFQTGGAVAIRQITESLERQAEAEKTKETSLIVSPYTDYR